MDHPTRQHRLGFSVALACLGLLQAMHAQAVTSTYPPVEVIGEGPQFRQMGGLEITGSSIVRKEQTQALPVQVITRQDIQRQGLTSLEQFIERLPSAVNGAELGLQSKSFNGFTNGALHGMPTGTLVLLNGKRLAPFGIQSISGTEKASVDLGLVPLSAVDRIEVLTDGASSLYGTDAIAGVINIITRTEYKGLEISADQSRPVGGAGQGRVASLVWGRGQLAEDGYSLRLSTELAHTQAVRGSDRPSATQGRIGFVHAGQHYEIDNPEVSGFTSPALLYSSGSTPPMLSGLMKNGECLGNSVTYRVPSGYVYPGGCKVNPLPGYDIYPESRSQKLHLMGEVLLPQGGTFYSELYHGQEKTSMGVNSWPIMAGRIVNQPGAVGYAEMQAAGLNPGNGFYYWRPDLPALQERLDKSLYRTEARAQRELDAPDVYGLLGQINVPLTNPGLLLPLDANNPLTAQLQALRNSWQPDVLGKTGLTALELRASRPWFEMNGKDSLVAWGLEARQETVSSSDLTGTQPAQSFSGKRHDLAAYTELQLPLGHDWDLIAALRTDRYSDVGSTTNGKLASRWAISPEWAVRASAGTGFRAPSVGQTLTATTPSVNQTLQTFTCNNDFNAVASALAQSTGKNVVCRDGDVFRMFANGNPQLKPEQSVQATLGLGFTPHRNLTLAADYWRVKMHDTLQFMSSASVLADPFKYQAQYVVDPQPILNPQTNTYFNRMGMLLQMQNLGQSLKEGIDFDARYRQPGDWGRWHLGVKATYILQSKEKATPDAAWASDLAAYSALSNTVVPRWRSQWTWGLERARAYWQMTVNHSSGYTDKTITAWNTDTQKRESVAGRQVLGFVTVDVMGTYQINPLTHFRWSVSNLLNRQPPLSFYSVSSYVWGVNSQGHSLLGRTAQLGLTVKF